MNVVTTCSNQSCFQDVNSGPYPENWVKTFSGGCCSHMKNAIVRVGCVHNSRKNSETFRRAGGALRVKDGWKLLSKFAIS